MARCRITNARTLRRLSEIVGFKAQGALTRGGTGHRVDVWGHPEDPRLVYSVWPDGTTEKSTYRVADRCETT